ncbi:LicD family protein [Streptococcus merionis]|uniref:LicD family protein n=1 Tax=Streptococcus merionis TaxID=400065 RepID=UPI003518A370
MKNDFTIKDVQDLAFEILKYIKEICEQHSINYYLAYGTLIGAVRHKGFIPWDDDIDIMMPREDFERLVVIMREFPHPYYRLISSETDNRFQVPLPKIIDSRTILIQDYDIVESIPLGVYVDIFLVDGAGDDYLDAVKHYDQAFLYYQLWKKSCLKLFPSSLSYLRGFLRWIKNLPYIVRGSKYYMKLLKEHNTTYEFSKSHYIATFETGTSDASKCIWKKTDFDNKTKLEFNGDLFQVPKEYEKILTGEYGDYMVLPDIDKQVSHHSYVLRWNEEFL